MASSKKNKQIFVCEQCGYQALKWSGKCPQCEAWNSIFEISSQPVKQNPASANAITLAQVSTGLETKISCGYLELDRVLGGGLVQGSTILLGGEPGIGKSTLVLQIALFLAQKRKVLYCSGEESPGQIRIRANRLTKKNGETMPDALHEGLLEHIIFLPNTDAEQIIAQTKKNDLALVIVDSIQTAHTEKSASGPGSVSQVRESAYELSNAVTADGTVLMIIAHVTKEGTIAGPKLLEHLVDVVLYFEGERIRDLRLVRAFKNRFGRINEIALLRMETDGLTEIVNPTGYFLDLGYDAMAPGVAIVPVREGTLILIVEVQALASEILYQAPRRAAEGIEFNRVQLMAAVLDKTGQTTLRNFDLFVKISSGVVINDTSADLALIMALASSYYNQSLPNDTAFVGEVSLTGLIRPVTMIQERISALETMGIQHLVMPKSQQNQAKDFSIEAIGVSDIGQILEMFFNRTQ